MAFFSARKEKQLTQGEFIHPSLVIWEDTSALRSASASYPLPVQIMSGGASGEQYADGTAVDASYKGNLVLGTDGSNYQILSVDASGNLNVNVVAGSAASEQYADATAVDASYKGNLILGTDGSYYQIISVDSDGNPQVDVLTLPAITIAASQTLDTVNTITNVVHIDDNGGSLTVDGVIDTELKTDDLDTGTGTDTQAIAGIALPGAGGHTLWDGTVVLGAGSASIGVLGANSGVDIGDVTINNGTGSGAVNIQDGGNSITVDASALDIRALTSSDIITVDQLKTDDFDTGTGVDTQSIAGIALPGSGGHTLWDGTVVLGAGSAAIGSVDVTSLPALPAGTNNIGDVDVATQPARAATTDSITAKLATDAIQDGLTAVTPKFAIINAASSGDNTVVAAVTGKKIRVLQYTFVCAAATDTTWKSGTGTGAVALSGTMSIAANSGLVSPFSPVGLFETAAGSALNLYLSAANQTSGTLVYLEI